MTPAANLDNSWRIGLGLAASRSLAFGHDVLFTFGPLGFLSQPRLLDVTTGALSLAFAAGAQIGLAAVVYGSAADTFGRAVGLVLAFLALGLPFQLSNAIVYASLFACAALLQREDESKRRWLPPVAGALAAFELLVKLNAGVIVLVLFALAVWRVSPRGLRAEGVLAASFAISLLVLWVASGNPVGDLPAWLHGSEHVVSSYSASMAVEVSSHSDYAAASVLVLGMLGLLVHAVRGLPRSRQTALLALYAVFVFAYLKESFVRHDGDHHLRFFGAFALAVLAFRWRGRERWGAALLLLVTVAVVALAPDVRASRLYRVDIRAHHALTQAADVVDSGRRHRTIAAAKAQIRNALAVPPHALALLHGKTVDVVPYELSAIWAYDLRWQPSPVFQWYAATDSYLDRLNANAIATRGAQRVLRQLTTPVDEHVPEFEAPASYVALVCHYRQLTAGSEWQVLGRTRNRCGQPQTLEVVHATAGQTVPVPEAPPGEMVVAEIDLPSSLLASLETTIFKPLHTPKAIVDGTAHRFVAATAAGPLVLRMARSAGFSARFGGGTSYGSLQLDRVTSPFTVTFQEIPVS